MANVATTTAAKRTAQQEYQRALEIARRDGLVVVGHGTRKADGAKVYCVPSRSEAGAWRIVAVGETHLTCDCPRSKNGHVCAHRAAVHVKLVEEAEARRQAQEEADRAEARRRAAAPLAHHVTNVKPFSIFK